VSRARDAEYSEYVAARLSWLRRLAVVLCGDWQRGDDLVQATLVKLYVRPGAPALAPGLRGRHLGAGHGRGRGLGRGGGPGPVLARPPPVPRRRASSTR